MRYAKRFVYVIGAVSINDTLAIAIVKPGLAPSAAGVALRRNEQKIRVTAFDFQGICKTTRSGNSGLLTNRK